MSGYENGTCDSCGKNLELETEAIALAITKIKRENAKTFDAEAEYEKVYALCVNPECLIKILNSIREGIEGGPAKNRTNAVGPTAPGAPGCCFNEPPYTSRGQSTK